MVIATPSLQAARMGLPGLHDIVAYHMRHVLMHSENFGSCTPRHGKGVKDGFDALPIILSSRAGHGGTME